MSLPVKIMKPSFHFHSKYFNTTEPRDYFINPGCYGDDLAAWLIRELENAGIKTTSKPKQEDFGWFFNFMVKDIEHCVVVGFQPNDIEAGDCWIGWIERNAGFISALFGGRHRGILPEAIEIIDSILSSRSEIRQLKWVVNRET